MNLHVGSSMHQTLVFLIPRKNIDPLDIIESIFENFGPVDGFHHNPIPSGSKLELYFANAETYQAKTKYRHVPVNFKTEDFQKVFGTYGVILEIGRYYWQINDKRILSGDGFIFFEQSQRKYPPLPEFIDLGAGVIHTKITTAPIGVPITISVQHTNQPTSSQPQPQTQAHIKTNVKKKRNSKKRLKNNSREHSHPADSNQ
ncbi:hypothetical protein BGZ80_004884, partial [Entomortierella chlamydospora]